ERVEQPGWLGLFRATAAPVISPRRRQVRTTPASLVCVIKKIHILEVNEKPFVKTSKSLERDTTRKEKCAGYYLDLPRLAVVPIAHEFAWKAGWEQTIQTEHLYEKPAGCWEA